ncbi:MAG: HDOD domain-containing protein, partial [Caldilineaceae bacterium]|nr:HDOD domain-containing protein [Caldilineaceae bacterium]
GLAAKVLQLVNSPLFGLRQQVNDPHQAVVLLGLETIKTLIVAAATFDTLQDAQTSELAEDICTHATRVGWIAQCIAKENGDATAIDWALAGSLLHDVGKLVLASQMPDLAGEVLDLVQLRRAPLYQVEAEVYGQTHAEIGAYLLGIWGFDERLVGAIACHHRAPTAANGELLSLSDVLYLANLLEHAWFPDAEAEWEVDLSALETLGISEQQLAKWFSCFRPAIQPPPGIIE